MSVGLVISVLSKIPWTEIAATAPILVKSAKHLNDIIRRYLGDSKSGPSASGKLKLSDLDEKINKIEIFEKEQSELVFNIGNQLDYVTSAIQIISKRVNYFMVLSSIGFLIALTAFILVLLK